VKLQDLFQRHEGKTLGFKRDLSSPEGVLKSLVAFANTSGGILLVGVEDGSRRVAGVADVLKAEERLASLIVDSIRPALLPELEVLSWRGLQVLAVEVHPSALRPHYLQSLGAEAGVFVRVGSTNRRAGPAQIEELKRWARMESFDEEPFPAAKSEVIDFGAASEFFAPFRKLTRAGLRAMRIVVPYQATDVPSVGGCLLFGKNRSDYFPDAWIQAGRFAGLQKSRLIDSTEIRSYLPQAVAEAVGFVQKHLLRESVIEGLRREERWSVPMVAIREAVTNAVAHADYSQQGAPIRVAIFDDRLEIENPGMLPFGLTIEDIQQGVSRLRNRVIGRVFQELRLIEQWGSGIQRMIEACQAAGLPAPRFEEIGTHFRVTLSSKRVGPPLADETDGKILGLLAARGPLSTAVIAKEIGLSARATLTRLRNLVETGRVFEVGKGPNDPRRTYAVAVPPRGGSIEKH
jgi:ATP-dependent DNA helicase RecG